MVSVAARFAGLRLDVANRQAPATTPSARRAETSMYIRGRTETSETMARARMFSPGWQVYSAGAVLSSVARSPREMGMPDNG